MSDTGKWAKVTSFVMGIVIVYLLITQQNKNKQIAELKKAVNENDALNDQIKKKLQELLQNNPGIDDDIAKELASIAALLEIEQQTKAILSLAKIIENLLKKLYQGTDGLKVYLSEKKKRKPSFEDYIDYARSQNVISKEDYHLIEVLKIIRNEEAHELDVKKDKGKMVACFLAGLGITFGLCKLVKASGIV